MIKQTMKNYSKRGGYDELYTPEYAIAPIIPYLNDSGYKTIWECTDYGGSNITKVLRDNGFSVISTNFDFLEMEPKEEYDIIITNPPPYSIKNKFLDRCYELGKPFMMLMPLTTLEGVFRGSIFKKHGIQLIVLDKRVNFMTDKKSCWFNTSWFCWKVLNKDLNFEQIDKG